MAKPSPTDPDLAASVLLATFTTTGVSQAVRFGPGIINVSVWNTFSGSVTLQKSYDGGLTWFTIDVDTSGTDLAFTGERHIQLQEGETGMLYRWNCTALASGTINCRASQG